MRRLKFNLGIALTLALLCIVGCSSGENQVILHDSQALLAVADGSRVDFGTVAPGTVSEKTVLVTNAGTTTATEFSVNPTTLPSPFSFKSGVFPGIGGSCRIGGSMDPGQICVIVVQFAPVQEGTYTQDLTFAYNDGASVQEGSIVLTAAAAIPVPKVASLSVVGGSLVDIGTVTPGASRDKTIFIANTGTGSATQFTINMTTLPPPFSFKGGVFSGGGSCQMGGSLDPGQSCSIIVRFSPPQLGTYRQALVLTYNDGANLQEESFSLAGTCALCDPDAASFGGGAGTTGLPYLVCSQSQLQNITSQPGKAFRLFKNLDLASASFAPIGSASSPFTGTFDGNSLAIDHLLIQVTDPNVATGLFGALSGATVQNLTLTNVSVSGIQDVGGIAGTASAASLIKNVSVTGAVTGSSSRFGGLVGKLVNSTIDNSRATVTVQNAAGHATSVAGGLVGVMQQNANITNSSASGTVSAQALTGGLAGVIDDHSAVRNSSTSASVNASGGAAGGLTSWLLNGSIVDNASASGAVTTPGGYAGGLVGTVRYGSTIQNSSASGNVTAGADIAGGLVGYLGESTVTHCHATGNVAAADVRVGGFAGYVLGASTIEKSFATGDAVGLMSVGGFAGGIEGWSVIKNCYARGAATGIDDRPSVGGFVGRVGSAAFVNSYSSGAVITRDQVELMGGFAGDANLEERSITTQSCYWDREASGLYWDWILNAALFGKTTAQMKTQSTFAGWDFSTIWTLPLNGYPILR
ncbi:MAG: GLUG motif-containing protein [Pseudomonadota bacterium]